MQRIFVAVDIFIFTASGQTADYQVVQESPAVADKPATLAKRLHGLPKSSGVVSCIASLPIDSLHGFLLASYILTVSVKCVALEILAVVSHTSKNFIKNPWIWILIRIAAKI